MDKLFKFVTPALTLILLAVAMRSVVIERGSIDTNRLDEDDAVAEANRAPVDWSKCEWVLEVRDPVTGARTFWVNGSPVQGKLKAYLEDPGTWERGDIIHAKNHPDGESQTGVLVPESLFESLTAQ